MMEIRPDPPNKFSAQPPEESNYTQAFYSTIKKIGDAVKDIISSFSNKFFFVTRQSFLPSSDYQTIYTAEYIKSVKDGCPTLYLFETAPTEVSLTDAQTRKLYNANCEIPDDLLKFAHRISLTDIAESRNLVLYSAIYEDNRLEVRFQTGTKFVIVGFVVDSLDLNSVEKDFLKQLMGAALQVFDIKVSVKQE